MVLLLLLTVCKGYEYFSNRVHVFLYFCWKNNNNNSVNSLSVVWSQWYEGQHSQRGGTTSSWMVCFVLWLCFVNAHTYTRTQTDTHCMYIMSTYLHSQGHSTVLETMGQEKPRTSNHPYQKCFVQRRDLRPVCVAFRMCAVPCTKTRGVNITLKA